MVGLGVFGAVSDGQVGTGSRALAAGSHMNLGQTSTETTPPTAPAVSMAVPSLRGQHAAVRVCHHALIAGAGRRALVSPPAARVIRRGGRWTYA